MQNHISDQKMELFYWVFLCERENLVVVEIAEEEADGIVSVSGG